MELAIAHRGCCSFRITAYGSTGHASEPEKATNAILKMNKVLNELLIYEEELRNAHHFLLPPPTISIGIISGGQKSNIVPDKCEIVIDRRLLPGESLEDVSDEFQAILRGIESNDKEARYRVENLTWCGAGCLKKDSAMI